MNPFKGYIDSATISPDPGGQYTVTLNGWIVSTLEPPADFKVGTNGASATVAEWLPRPDVARNNPDIRWASNSGFRARFRLPHPLRQHETFYFLATLQSGSKLAGAFPPAQVNIAEVETDEESLPTDEEVKNSVEHLRAALHCPERDQVLRELEQRLLLFLSHNDRLAVPASSSPKLSIIIPVRDRAECTFNCFVSLLPLRDLDLEVLLVDNGSTDLTGELLRRTTGVRVIRNDRPLHFLDSVNQAAAVARGDVLLMLNNDCFPLPGAVPRLLKTLAYSPRIGAVGGMLIRPDGTLQEAGCAVTRSGSPRGIGRGDSPQDPRYAQVVRVDYCSGALLATPRSVFDSLGGFDARYRPAYFEDLDYCLTLREAGYDVLYEPRAAAFHVEYGSARSLEGTVRLHLRNQDRLRRKHRALFSPAAVSAADADLPLAESPRRPRVLVIDDQVPMYFKGAGFPRSKLLLDALAALGCTTTLYTTAQPRINRYTEVAALDRRIALIENEHRDLIASYLSEQGSSYDLVIVSRPHNMQAVRDALRSLPEVRASFKLLYDTESIFCLRDIRRAELIDGRTVSELERKRLLDEELDAARIADGLLCVTDGEHEICRGLGLPEPHTLGYAVRTAASAVPFAERNGFVGVGPLVQPDAPNVDGLVYFLNHVQPLLAAVLPAERHPVRWVGKNQMAEELDKFSDRFTAVGPLEELQGELDTARVFIAPIRFGAGISLKLLHAAAAGIPAVCTPFLAEVMGWTDRVEVLVASTPEEFARSCVDLHENQALWESVRANALAAVEREYSHLRFVSTIAAALGTALPWFAAREQLSEVASRLADELVL